MRDTIQVWARIPPKQARELDRVARWYQLSRSATIAKLIDDAIRVTANQRELDKAGIR